MALRDSCLLISLTLDKSNRGLGWWFPQQALKCPKRGRGGWSNSRCSATSQWDHCLHKESSHPVVDEPGAVLVNQSPSE